MLAVRAFAAGMLAPQERDRPHLEPIAIDLNRAPIGELMALPGIGRARAEAIVLHRVRNGPFASVDAVAAVDGIGDETMAALRPFAAASSPPTGR